MLQAVWQSPPIHSQHKGYDNSYRYQWNNWLVQTWFDAWEIFLPEEVLNKFLYGETPPRGPTPYPLIHHFSRKRYPFRAGVPRSCPRIGHYREYPPGLLDDQSLVYTGSHKSSISLSFSFHCLCWKNDPQSEKKRKENHHRNNLFEILKLKKQYGWSW